jgi:hypothetical protein
LTPRPFGFDSLALLAARHQPRFWAFLDHYAPKERALDAWEPVGALLSDPLTTLLLGFLSVLLFAAGSWTHDHLFAHRRRGCRRLLPSTVLR